MQPLSLAQPVLFKCTATLVHANRSRIYSVDISGYVLYCPTYAPSYARASASLIKHSHTAGCQLGEYKGVKFGAFAKSILVNTTSSAQHIHIIDSFQHCLVCHTLEWPSCLPLLQQYVVVKPWHVMCYECIFMKFGFDGTNDSTILSNETQHLYCRCLLHSENLLHVCHYDTTSKIKWIVLFDGTFFFNGWI